jgi:hypothetical protein
MYKKFHKLVAALKPHQKPSKSLFSDLKGPKKQSFKIFKVSRIYTHSFPLQQEPKTSGQGCNI